MGQRSPLVTLAATAVGLVALLVVNSTQTGSPTATDTAAATPTTVPSATEPTPTAEPATEPPGTTTPPTSEPAQPTAPQGLTVVYAGRTTEREATVAIAVKGDRAVAYVCDGRRLEAWLTGTVADGKVALRSRTGERLAAAVDTKTATGTLTLDGRELRFAIDAAGPPAGLYRSSESSRTIGWIVLPDGSQVGVDNDGSPAPAPQLDPATGFATGVPTPARSVNGDETF
jgi:hypothetical protein